MKFPIAIMILSLLVLRYVDCNSQCNTKFSPIGFKKKTEKLDTQAKANLENAANKIKQHPECNVKVIGYGADSKIAQQLSWSRVNAVIRYLIEGVGISPNRFVFIYGETGNPNKVDLSTTNEVGTNTQPAPHPNYRNRD